MCESPINSARILAVGRPDEQTTKVAISVSVLQLVYLNCEPFEVAVEVALELALELGVVAKAGFAATEARTRPKASKMPVKASNGLKVFTCIV